MMANKGVRTQKQVEFLCPKMNHLSVVEKFSMHTPKVTKKFRFLYNKGVVHDDGTTIFFLNRLALRYRHFVSQQPLC
jgi:hypothetical protein|tara:strand:- start:232 stop:462 length:231 start_codon:yes stop_codon:yes gene_type:complete